MISYILPTRDRSERLRLTLEALGSLRGHEDGEVIVIDNASRTRPSLPARLANGLLVRLIASDTNVGAACRNAAAEASDERSEWIVMLDDDSHPTDTGYLRRLGRMDPEVGAVSSDIYQPGLAQRESGGLPEVFVGCGVAIRRKVFLELKGYDAALGYHAEEHDFAARMIHAGYRVVFDPWFRVEHHKAGAGRDGDGVMARLVRNNGWILERYAPESVRRAMLRDLRRRYRIVARREGTLRGCRDGLWELKRTIRQQERRPMPRELFERFTGLSYAREAIGAAMAERAFASARVVDEGRSGWVVRKALAELRIRVVNEPDDGTRRTRDTAGGAGVDEVLVIGTMSPGPMLDAYERRTAMPGARGPRVIAPWRTVTQRYAGRSPEILTGVGRAAGARTPIPA